jgi:hypothetical protein
MKQNKILLVMFVALTAMLSSCEIAGGIFKAGMWVGVVVVVLIIAIVLWLINKVRR